jgi:tetratricopeptide (TPR) repeat protein
MGVDMLDFAGEELYFDEAMQPETEQCIEEAAENYGGKNSENLLLRAYFLEPEHPMVLVALYRYYYYQHRYADALIVAERVLRIIAVRLGLPENWQDISEQQVEAAVGESMTELRFYLLALKGSGYLEMRLENYHGAIERLKKIVAVDAKDRLSVSSLLQIAEDEVNRQAGIYRLRF